MATSKRPKLTPAERKHLEALLAEASEEESGEEVSDSDVEVKTSKGEEVIVIRGSAVKGILASLGIQDTEEDEDEEDDEEDEDDDETGDEEDEEEEVEEVEETAKPKKRAPAKKREIVPDKKAPEVHRWFRSS